jgi:hypothetical protein
MEASTQRALPSLECLPTYGFLCPKLNVLTISLFLTTLKGADTGTQQLLGRISTFLDVVHRLEF